MTRPPRRNTAPKGWVVKEWDVKCIIAESPTMYRVQWEGLDPKTQTSWKPSWEYKIDVNAAAITHWESLKARRAERERAASKDGIDAIARWKIVDQSAPEQHGESVIPGGANSSDGDENPSGAPLPTASFSGLSVKEGVSIVLNAATSSATIERTATKAVAYGYVSDTTISDIEGEHSQYDSSDSDSTTAAGEDDPDWVGEEDDDSTTDGNVSSDGSTSAINGYVLTTSYKASPVAPTQDTITCAILCKHIYELRQQLDALVDIHMACKDGEYKDGVFRRAEALMQLIDGAKGAFLLAKARIARDRIEGKEPEKQRMA